MDQNEISKLTEDENRRQHIKARMSAAFSPLKISPHPPNKWMTVDRPDQDYVP